MYRIDSFLESKCSQGNKEKYTLPQCFKKYSNVLFEIWPKLTIFGIFNELLSTQNFARNIECDFFGRFSKTVVLYFQHGTLIQSHVTPRDEENTGKVSRLKKVVKYMLFNYFDPPLYSEPDEAESPAEYVLLLFPWAISASSTFLTTWLASSHSLANF